MKPNDSSNPSIIRCHKRHLEARCRERGYTLDQVMACVVSQDGDQWTIDPQHPSYPKAGLGDKVEKALKTIGVTEERVSRLIGRPCGCKERKIALNKLGRTIRSALKPKEQATEITK